LNLRFARLPNEPESLLLALLPLIASALFAYAVGKKMGVGAILSGIGFIAAMLLVFSKSW
jgi:hypothetical protein